MTRLPSTARAVSATVPSPWRSALSSSAPTASRMRAGVTLASSPSGSRTLRARPAVRRLGRHSSTTGASPSRRSISSAPAARAARAASRRSSSTAESFSVCSSAAMASRRASGSGWAASSSSRSCSAVIRLRSWWETSPTSSRSRWTSSESAAAEVSSTSETRSSSGMPCLRGAERKSPAPRRAARSATPESGSASRRAVTVATTVPAATDSSTSPSTTSVAWICWASIAERGSSRVIAPPIPNGSDWLTGFSPTFTPIRRSGRPGCCTTRRPFDGTASCSSESGIVEPSASRRASTRSRSAVRSARVMSSTSRHVVTASGAPSTSAVIVTTRSVDCRIRRRTGLSRG